MDNDRANTNLNGGVHNNNLNGGVRNSNNNDDDKIKTFFRECSIRKICKYLTFCIFLSLGVALTFFMITKTKVTMVWPIICLFIYFIGVYYCCFCSTDRECAIQCRKDFKSEIPVLDIAEGQIVDIPTIIEPPRFVGDLNSDRFQRQRMTSILYLSESMAIEITTNASTRPPQQQQQQHRRPATTTYSASSTLHPINELPPPPSYEEVMGILR